MAVATQIAAPTKIVTGIVRFSYVHVWEPVAHEEGEVKKYSVALLIPKSDKASVKKIKDAIAAAIDQGKTKLGGKVPANLKTPLRDGDDERSDDENYEGHYFMNANANTKPGIVDASASPIMQQDDFYSGCYGRASITFYAYAGKSKGIACGLNHVMKTKDGESLGGRSTAESDFADVLEDDDML